MARCLRCRAGNEWIEGTVKARIENVKLTDHQIQFLERCMQDYLDVSQDKGVLRDARNIHAKLVKVMRPIGGGRA